MTAERQVNEGMKKLGLLAGVGEDWYVIKEENESENGEKRYGIYAKTESILEKVEKEFNRILGELRNDTE